MLPFALWSCKPVLNCDRFIAKHALQNIQNDCHQWLSHSFKVHQIRFRPGLRPGPRWAEGEGTAPLTQISGSAPEL